MLTPEFASTLRRKMERLRDGHWNSQNAALEESLALFEVNRVSSIPNCLRQFRDSSAKVRGDFGDTIRVTVMDFLRDTHTVLQDEDRVQIVEAVASVITSELEAYESQFEAFEAALLHRGKSYGVSIDLQQCRADIIRSQFVVQGANWARSVQEILLDDLQEALLKQANVTTMANEVSQPHGKLEANSFFKLEPNFMGIGVNLNYLIRWFKGRTKKSSKDVAGISENSKQ
jgi:molybdopterin converting factor small subunit